MSHAPHVLVVVESRHGSTREISDALAERLAARGCRVTVTAPDDGPDPHTGFDADAIVVGSAVYVGKWLRPAVAFLERHAEHLDGRAVWLFSSGPLAENPMVVVGMDADYLEHLESIVPIRGHQLFGGCMRRADLGPLETLIAKAVRAPAGDFRDWEDVDRWAERIVSALPARA